jgi:4-amino-4-deoxy-L-arabinose transferase-like glycosyltransferase
MTFGLFCLSLSLTLILKPDLSRYGLQAANDTGQLRLEQVAFITSNDARFEPERALTFRWRGYFYQPQASEVYFRVPPIGQAKLTLGNDVVFDTTAQPPFSEAAVSYPVSGWQPLSFEVVTPEKSDGYFQAGLEWQSPLGWSLLPAPYLAPEPLDSQTTPTTLQRWQWSRALIWLAAICGLTMIGQWLWAKARTRTALGLAAVVILALSLRLIFLRDYAAQPTADVLGIGSDHRGYQSAALEFLRGQWPPANQAFYVQPGMSLTLGMLYNLAGPNIRVAQFLQMLCGALTTLLVFDLARHLLDDSAGWAAALLWATFPLPIFYEAQLLTHGLEAPAGALLLWLWMQSRRDWRWQWSITLGLALGAAAVLRPTFLVLAPLIALDLAWQNRAEWRLALAQIAILACITLIPIAPITLHNYRVDGRFQLLTSNSDVTLYLGNNRDSTGLGEYSPAFRATHTLVNRGETTYYRQTFDEIRADPLRWVQLMIRKTALYFGDQELPNNVDFYTEGAAISPLLAALPLRFGAMMALGIAGFGLAATLPKPGSGVWIVGLYAALQLLVTIVYHVFSRFRAPIYPALAVFAGITISIIIGSTRGRAWRRLVLDGVAVAASAAFISATPFVAESVMSRPILAALPVSARPLNAPIGDSLTLLGYDPLPAVKPGQPLFVTLYWQSSKPITKELFVTIQLFGGDLKVAQGDQAIGAGGFPDYPTTQWSPGQIIRDSLLIELPDDAPTPLALNVLVAGYDREAAERTGETTFGPLPLTNAEPLALPTDAQPLNAAIGAATLLGYRTTSTTLTLYWQAGAPMAEDGVVFVHLFDSANRFVAGKDSRPRNGLYSTLAWQEGEGIVDEHTLPDAPPGEYTLKIGMYDAATQNRLPVVNANGETLPEGVLTLGTITRP